MMTKPRLIDANKLIDDIKAIHYTCTGMRAGKVVLSEFAQQYRNDILKTIDEQPTAYDIDKVVEQLEELKTKPCADTESGCDSFIVCEQCFVQNAIEIVKGGAE